MPATVVYDLTPDDYVQFNMHLVQNSPAVQRMRRNSVIRMSAALAVAGILTSISQHTVLLLVIFGTAAVLCMLFGSKWWDWESKRKSKKVYADIVRPASSHCTLEIDSDGLRTSGNSGIGTYKWSAVDKIVEDTHHTYMYVGPLTGLIIPNRSFATDDERKRFFEMAREYREAAAGLTYVNI